MQCRLSQSKHSTYQAPKEVDKIQDFQKGYYRSSKKNKTMDQTHSFNGFPHTTVFHNLQQLSNTI